MFDMNANTVNIFRMGHNGLIHYDSKNKKIQIIEPQGMAFGMAETEQFEKEISSQLISYNVGDLFIFLTDGFLEAMNESKDLFGEERACNLITAHSEESASFIIEALQNEIRNFTAGLAQDDATGVIVKIIEIIDNN